MFRFREFFFLFGAHCLMVQGDSVLILNNMDLFVAPRQWLRNRLKILVYLAEMEICWIEDDGKI
jgi:hypothetical protein